MKRVLLAGGAGFLGCNLREAFESAGHAVVVADRAERPGLQPHVAVSLAEPERLFDLMRSERIDTVVHLACGLLPSSAVEDFVREQRDIVLPSFRLMDHCARSGVHLVLVSSGGTVYGDTQDERVREDHALAPKSHYGLSKLMLEEYARLAERQEGLRCTIVRPSNPYGRHQRLQGAQGIVAVAMGRLLAGQALEIWGDGSSVRDYLDVADLSAAVRALVLQGACGTFNIGSGVGHSINEVLTLIHQASGRELAVTHRPARGVDVKRIVLDTTALAAVMPWQPRTLAQGLHAMWQAVAHGR